MKILPIGYSVVDFADKKDPTRLIQGITLHYVYDDLVNEHMVGRSAVQKFINRKVAANINLKTLVDREHNADFDQKGHILALTPIA